MSIVKVEAYKALMNQEYSRSIRCNPNYCMGQAIDKLTKTLQEIRVEDDGAFKEKIDRCMVDVWGTSNGGI